MALLGAACLLPRAHAELPTLGGQHGGTLTAAEERQLGQQFLRQAQSQLRFLSDHEVTSFVRHMGRRIVAQTNFRAYPFQFHVVADSRLNAFAVPGGHIFVHTGLIETADTLDELAGVIAHEVAHITQRHIARRMASAQRTQLSTLLLALAGIAAGMQGQGEAAEALILGAGAYNQQQMLAYSRDHEREADRLGIQYLARAGYDPEGLPHFLEKLQDWSQLQGSSPAPYLSTHPLTGERVADARGRVEQLQGTGATEPLSEAAFQRIRAKTRALTAPPEEAVAHFRARVAKGSQPNTPDRYGLAIALARAGHTAEAERALQELVSDHPETVAFHRELGNLQLRNGKAGQATESFRAALERHPGDPHLQGRLARALLADDQPRKAREMARQLVREHPERPEAHQLLASAYDRLDQPIEAHRAEAEARWRSGHRSAALQQLRLAERLARERGSPLLEQIQARIRELEPDQGQGADTEASR
jgi:predicted Zn-dependent protease